MFLEASHRLPDPGGHDLRAVPASGNLILTTGAGVRLFDRDAPSFRAPPAIGLRPLVKCVDIHPATGAFIPLQATAAHRWHDTFEQLEPKATYRLESDCLNKVR